MKSKKNKSIQAIEPLAATSKSIWRFVQLVVWLVGVGILVALLFFPKFGIHAFWNVLIPIAPLLLIVATGLWRNICPLGTTSLLPRHLGLSKQKRLKRVSHEKLTLVGVALLLLIVPLRHTILDTNGPATAYAIISLAILAVYMGFQYNWKSGWCSGLCPIHPVEKLYGSKVAITLPNAHCHSCKNCIAPCPDSTPEMNPMTKPKNLYKTAGIIMIGGFPGYIWGWFQVPDYTGAEGIAHLPFTYAMPFLGLIFSLIVYLIIKEILNVNMHDKINKLFATAAIIAYYWFRIPALFGFGIHPGDGMLVNLTNVLPSWFPIASQLFVTLFFIWFLLLRKQTKQWTIRPVFEKREKKVKKVQMA